MMYIAKSLQLAPHGQSLTTSLDELLYPEKEDKRSGEDIAKDIINSAGLNFEV